MDEEYPYYVRTRKRSRSLEFDSCPGKNCDGVVENDSGLLNMGGTTWECQECGIQYHLSESPYDEYAGVVSGSAPERTTQGHAFDPEDGVYRRRP